MPMDGTGIDSMETRSTGPPWASIASMHSSTISWVRGRIASTRFTLSSGISIMRWAVCSGGSMCSRAGLTLPSSSMGKWNWSG